MRLPSNIPEDDSVLTFVSYRHSRLDGISKVLRDMKAQKRYSQVLHRKRDQNTIVGIKEEIGRIITLFHTGILLENTKAVEVST